MGLDSHGNEGEFSILHAYSQLINESRNRLTGFLLRVKKSNLISSKVRIGSSSEEPRKAFLSRGDLSFGGILDEESEMQNGAYFDLDKIISNRLEILFDVPVERTDGSENPTFSDESGEGGNISSTYSLVRVYERNRLISLYSVYTLFSRDYFCTLASEYLSRINYQLGSREGGEGSTGVTRIAIEQRLLEWRGNIERLLHECIISPIDEYADVRSNMHRWLDTIRDLSFSPSIYRIIIPKYISEEASTDGIDYLVYKLNNIDYPLLDFLLSSLNLDEKISFLKRIFGRKDSFFIESGLLMDEESVGSSIFLKPAVNPFLVESSCIECIGTKLPNGAYSATGRQDWDLFLDNLNYGKGSNRNIGSISGSISDEVDTPNFIDYSHLPVLNCAGRDFISIIRRRDSLVGGYSSSYSDILENSYTGSGDEVIPSLEIGSLDTKNITSSIQSQVSDSLLPNSSQRTERETIDHILATTESTPSDLDESAIPPLTHSDRFLDSISDLRGLLTGLNLSPRETGDSSLSSCGSDGNYLERTLINSKLSADWRSRPRLKNSGVDQVDSEGSIEKRSNSRNDSIGNQFYQNDSHIGYFWESEESETLYWSKKFSLCSSVASRSPTGLTGEKVLYENTRLADTRVQKEPILPSHLINFDELSKDLNKYKISWIFWRDNICEKWSPFGEYIPRFFTPNWWRYFYDLIREIYPEIVLKVSDDLNYTFPGITERVAEDIGNARACLSLSLRSRFRNDSISNVLSKIDLSIFEEITNQTQVSHSRWSVFRFSNKYAPSYLVFSILFVLAFLKHYLSAVSGSNSPHLWKRFNITGYLIDPMRGFYLEKVMYSPSTRQMQTKDLLIHSLKRFLNYTNNIIFYYLVKNELDSWILRRKSSDTLKINKQLLTQYLVTNKTISKYESRLNSNYDSLSGGINHEPTPEEGSNLLSYLLRIRQNDLSNYEICELDPAEKWALLALERNILLSATMRRKGIPNIPCRDVPILLSSGLLPSEGVPLVGPIETGRSYVVRDIASNSYFPSVRLPLRKLLYNRSYFNNVRGTFISKQSVNRLNLIFAIAKEMSPCTIWIQDIHELNVNRLYHRLEADPRFLLCLILRSIGNGRRNPCIRKNLVIASTHVPAKVDPASIAPNWSNQLINLRGSNRRQRQKELSILSRVKGFEIEADPSFLEGTGSGTTGYSKRDLFSPANEALLITTSRRRKIVSDSAIKLALRRQNSIVTYIGNGIRFGSGYEILPYNIGKAILKNGLIDTSPADPSFIGSNTLKKRFYHLYNWYLEPLITESTIKEFAILPHILGLLAGLAARDPWFGMDMREEENLVVIDKVVENDSNLACGISENLLRDFLCSEICRSRSQFANSPPLPSSIEPRYSPDIISASRSYKSTKKGVSKIPTDSEMEQSSEVDSIPKEVSRGITWSPKFWRFGFMRSGSYESIRVLSESNNLYNSIFFHRNQDQIPQRDFELNKIKSSGKKSHKRKGYLFSYKRASGKSRQRDIKRLENQLDNLSLREQFLELGIPNSSNQYETQCNRSDEPILFLGGRFTWDPMLLSQPDHNIPSSRHSLLAKQELVRRLYVTYGTRREREKHFSNEKIRNFFLLRGYDRKSITELSTKRWKNFPSGEERHFEYVKETQFMHIYLQYPQIFVPIHSYQSIPMEDLQERFLRFRLMVHRDRWMRRNRHSSKDFLIHNMLFESYHYLFNLFRFSGTSPD
uniref:Ycf2 n=1 Tax=Dipteris conjugata TaxID=32108 RepID=A0A0B5EEI5_9MONI|nr:Ycf2 [Dipteris conjugata]